MTGERGIDPLSSERRADLRALETARRAFRGGRAIWCGGVLPGGQASSNLLGHGAVELLPMVMIGLLLAAATIWMVRRWGARPPVLPPGVEPPSPPAEPHADELPARAPVPERRPPPAFPLTS